MRRGPDRRTRREMHNCVGPVVAGANPEGRVDHLAVVGDVDPHVVRAGRFGAAQAVAGLELRDRHAVLKPGEHVEHEEVPVLEALGHDGLARVGVVELVETSRCLEVVSE